MRIEPAWLLAGVSRWNQGLGLALVDGVDERTRVRGLSATTVQAISPLSKGSAWVTSWACLAVSGQRAALPSASTSSAWILVLNRCEIVRSLGCRLFPGAGVMAIDTDDGSINEHLTKTAIFCQFFEHCGPDPALLPACKPVVYTLAFPELLRKITPRRAGACESLESPRRTADCRRHYVKDRELFRARGAQSGPTGHRADLIERFLGPNRTFRRWRVRTSVFFQSSRLDISTAGEHFRLG
jgi:hypothetical protein